jgi:nucleotide-binding universal stress UspA family protein
MPDNDDRNYPRDSAGGRGRPGAEPGYRHPPTGLPPRVEPVSGRSVDDPLRVRRIVVGVDGSDSSLEAMRHAQFIASNFSCTVEVIGAWQIAASVNPYVPTQQWSPEADAEGMIIESIAEVFGEQRPMWLQWSVRQGPAARVLIEASKDADLVIVGSRGHGGVVGLLLGSVSASCAESAHCPVLVMH